MSLDNPVFLFIGQIIFLATVAANIWCYYDCCREEREQENNA